MKTYPPRLFLAVLSVCLLLPPGAEPNKETQASLVIYNRNFAVVSETADFPLSRGKNEIILRDIPETIQADSISLKFADSRDVNILEQRTLHPPTQESFLKANEGKIIKFEITAPQTGERWIREGRIIRAGGNPIIEMDGNMRFGLPGRPLFDAPDEGFVPGPALFFKVESARRRPAKAELSYIAERINWTSNYNIYLREEDDFAALKGVFLITSNTGKTYKKARVHLLAGDVSRAGNILRPQAMRAISHEAAADALPAVVSRELDEYHLYSVENPVTVGGLDNIGVEFLAAESVKINREYVFDGTIRGKVQVFVNYKNSEDNNLGIPMPAGKVKIYRLEEDFKILVGEDNINHTPPDEEVRIYTGTAFDLVGEHKQTDLTRIAARENEESYQITIRNRKKEPVEIKILERPGRRDWEITESSHRYERIDAQALAFMVSVPPGGEKSVSYTIRLRW